MQHDFMHLSFFKDDFKEFVDTLVVALRTIERSFALSQRKAPASRRAPFVLCVVLELIRAEESYPSSQECLASNSSR